MKTLETQIMMGINAGLTGVPYWGDRYWRFVPINEFTGELFVRWFQFGAFCPSFRCHGRTWQLRRPWGRDTGSYGLSKMGSNAASILSPPENLHNATVDLPEISDHALAADAVSIFGCVGDPHNRHNVPVTLDHLPLVVRAGTILPTGPVKHYVNEPGTAPIQLTIYPRADGRFQLYIDDGLSFDYEKG